MRTAISEYLTRANDLRLLRKNGNKLDAYQVEYMDNVFDVIFNCENKIFMKIGRIIPAAESNNGDSESRPGSPNKLIRNYQLINYIF